MSWVDEIDGSIIPIRGMNNHGGLKVLACDTDGCSRRSNAVKVSVEMYGVENPAGSSEETTTPIEYCGTEYRIFQDSYNHSKPYKDGGDGKLASWPIIAAGTRMVGEISLMGGHFDDWQLWFRGEGQIELPEHCYTDWTVGTETAEDFRYAFEAADIPVEVAGTQIEHKGIIVKEYQREEKFGYTCETDDEGNAVSKKIL